MSLSAGTTRPLAAPSSVCNGNERASESETTENGCVVGNGEGRAGTLPSEGRASEGAGAEESGLAWIEGPRGTVRVLLVDECLLVSRPLFSGGSNNIATAAAAAASVGAEDASDGKDSSARTTTVKGGEQRLSERGFYVEGGAGMTAGDGNDLLVSDAAADSVKYDSTGEKTPSGCFSSPPLVLLGLASLARRSRERLASGSFSSPDDDSTSAEQQHNSSETDRRQSCRRLPIGGNEMDMTRRSVNGGNGHLKRCGGDGGTGDWFCEADLAHEGAVLDDDVGLLSEPRDGVTEGQHNTSATSTASNGPVQVGRPGAQPFASVKATATIGAVAREAKPAAAEAAANSGAATGEGQSQLRPRATVAEGYLEQCPQDGEQEGHDERSSKDDDVREVDGDQHQLRGMAPGVSNDGVIGGERGGRRTNGNGNVERPFRELEMLMMGNLDGPLKATPNRFDVVPACRNEPAAHVLEHPQIGHDCHCGCRCRAVFLRVVYSF